MAGPVRYQIEHVSRYSYTKRGQCVMLLCLEPRKSPRQRLLHFEIETQPPVSLSRETDCFGNARHLLALHQAHQALTITTRATIEVAATPLLPARLYPGAWEALRAHADWDFTQPSALVRPSPALDAFVQQHGIAPADDPLASLLHLCDTLHRCLHYIPGSTSAESSVEHILATGRGVCQDYSHLMIAIARSWGIPARYVSGYLRPGGCAVGNATHAWVECRLPTRGWVGFDPTNKSLAGAGNVCIAVGRDYRDVSPTRGILHGGGKTRLDVTVQMHSTPSP